MGGFKDADGKWICHFGDSTQYYPSEGSPPCEADARLIAAATELLAACKQAEKLIRNGGVVPIQGKTWEQLTAVIATATDSD